MIGACPEPRRAWLEPRCRDRSGSIRLGRRGRRCWRADRCGTRTPRDSVMVLPSEWRGNEHGDERQQWVSKRDEGAAWRCMSLTVEAHQCGAQGRQTGTVAIRPGRGLLLPSPNGDIRASSRAAHNIALIRQQNNRRATAGPLQRRYPAAHGPSASVPLVPAHHFVYSVYQGD